MNDKDLEIIKDRQLFLKSGERSTDVVLVDSEGDGDMYFSFELQYTSDENKGKTDVNVLDSHHAHFVIETMPKAVTQPKKLIRIGNYGKDGKPLYVGFLVQPQISGEVHSVTISFYVEKGGDNGDNQ